MLVESYGTAKGIFICINELNFIGEKVLQVAFFTTIPGSTRLVSEILMQDAGLDPNFDLRFILMVAV